MDLEIVKRYLEHGILVTQDNNVDEQNKNNTSTPTTAAIKRLPRRFFEGFVRQNLHVHVVEPGRLLCSMRLPPSLLNAENFLHGGVTATLVDLLGTAVFFTAGVPSAGVSVDINVSYFDAACAEEEIEIEARILRIGKAVAVASIEFRKKLTGKAFAHGRHTKYLALTSKL